MILRSNQSLGFLGETAAASYLISQGYKILERNFKKRYGEIDIVALDGKTLVFVEVKTRKSNKYGTAEEAITPWKLRVLIKSAQYYKLIHPNLPDSVRVDFISVYLSIDNKIEKVKLYKNITG
ncbi:YraN family protein [Candidatus Gottesmanbacteria bacterium]|nr:YraN family protein [Candidatus Gottesmanbacteria bacterium]